MALPPEGSCTILGRASCASALVATATVASTAAPGLAHPASDDWDAFAQYKSGGDWTISIGDGYCGGLQFHPSIAGSDLPGRCVT